MTVAASTNSRSVLASLITDMYSAASLSVALRSMPLQADVLFNPIPARCRVAPPRRRSCQDRRATSPVNAPAVGGRSTDNAGGIQAPAGRAPNRRADSDLSLIHISEPTRLGMISYAVFCLKKKNI